MTKTKVGKFDANDPLGNKPASGLSGSDPTTSIQTPSGNAFSSDLNQKPVNIDQDRIGDWYYSDNGVLSVVPGSETDIARKSLVVVGEGEKQTLKPSDWVDVLGSSISTAINLGKTGSKIGPAGAVIGTIGGLLIGGKVAYDEYDKAYSDAYLSQDIDTSFAYKVTENDDGTRKYAIDPEIAAKAGYGSGSLLRQKSSGRERTGASIGDDGTLNIAVTPLFAMSDEYAELEDTLKDLFPNGITKEMGDRVADEETGETIIEEIDRAVRVGENNFYYLAESIAKFKLKAPDASDKALLEACQTQLAGTMDKKSAETLQIVVYDLDNNRQEMTAKEYLDSISSKSLSDRNAYMSEIGNKILSPDISDDEKAVLQAQSNTLYAASTIEGGEYEGMFKLGFSDSVLSTTYGPTTGLNEGKVLDALGLYKNANLETFDVDEAGAVVGKLRTIGIDIAEVLAMNWAFDRFGPALTSAAGSLLGDTKIGNFLKSSGAISAGFGESAGFGSKAALIGTRLAQSVAADAALNGIRYGAHSAFGNDYDFAKNLWEDIAWDILLTEGPEAYVQTLNGDTWRWERVKTKGKTKYSGEPLEGEVIDDGNPNLYSKEYKKAQAEKNGEPSYKSNMPGPTIVEGKVVAEVKNEREGGDYESGLVRRTSRELSQKRSDLIVRLNDNNIARTTHELFHDRNAAISEGYHIVNSLLGGSDSTLRLRQLEAGYSTNTQKKRQISEYYSLPENKALKQKFDSKIMELTGGKVRKLTVADKQYWIAKAQRHRFMKEFKGRKAMQMKVLDKYNPYLKAVGKERAKQLDELFDIAVEIAAANRKYALEAGWWSSDMVGKFENSNDKFVPIWSRKHNYRGGSPGWQRREVRELRNKEVLYDVEDMDDPILTLFDAEGALLQNIAKNESAKAIVEAASIPGNTQIWIESDTIVDEGGSDKKSDKSELFTHETELLRKYSDEFSATYDKIVKRVEKEVPTEEQWRADNKKSVEESEAWKDIAGIVALKKEKAEVSKEYLRLSNIVNGETDEDISYEEWKKASEDYDYYGVQLTRISQEIEQASGKIYTDTLNLMEAQKAKHKYSPVELDIEYYGEIYLKDNIKNAINDLNTEGKLVEVISTAVELANPYDVSREQIIKKRAGKAAEKFRSQLARNNELKRKIERETTLIGKKNAAEDAIYDFACRVISSAKQRLGIADREDDVIDFGDDENFFARNNNRPANAIDVRIDGKTHRVRFGGPLATWVPKEFYAPEFWTPSTKLETAVYYGLKPIKAVSRVTRTLLTSLDPTRPLVNLARDFSLSQITTAGFNLMNPDYLRKQAYEAFAGHPEAQEAINNGWMLVLDDIENNPLTQVFEGEKKNTTKRIIRNARLTTMGKSLLEQKLAREKMGLKELIKDTPSYVKKGFITYMVKMSQKNWVEKLSIFNDSAETLTRKRVASVTYFNEIIEASKRGESVDSAIESALHKAYFYGKEATTAFERRGKVIKALSEYVPYLSQAFSSKRSIGYTFTENPIGTRRALEATTVAYCTLLAIVLSNEESRERYFLLSEFYRSNCIMVPLTNDMIVTVRIDENLAAFLAPFRRTIESLQGVDQEAFYLTFADALNLVTGFDLSGFSEEDKLNLSRGFEKLGAQLTPTAIAPLIENYTGRDMYYGTDISVDEDYLESFGIYNPTPGQLTKKSKDSKALAAVANATGIPQWKLQNIVESYGGNAYVGKLVLSTIDKLAGATEAPRGGQDWIRSVFVPFCGGDQNAATSAMWAGINKLEKDKEKLKGDIKKINSDIEAAAGDEKAELIKKKQKMIQDYGLSVTDFLRSYMEAYEITGGLSKKDANRIWYLFDISGESDNADYYAADSLESYYVDKTRNRANDRTTSLAALSGLDDYVNPLTRPYHQSYALDALKDSVYGRNYDTMAKVALLLEDTKDYNNSFTKLRSDVQNRRSKLLDAGNYDAANALAYEYDKRVLEAIAPTLQEAGLEESLKSNKIITKYLEDWVIVPTDYFKDAKGRWVSKLPAETSKGKAFNRRFILDMYGLLDEEED